MREYHSEYYGLHGVQLLGKVTEVSPPYTFKLVEHGKLYNCFSEKEDLGPSELVVGEKYLVTGELIEYGKAGFDLVCLFFKPITLAEAMQKKREREERKRDWENRKNKRSKKPDNTAVKTKKTSDTTSAKTKKKEISKDQLRLPLEFVDDKKS